MMVLLLLFPILLFAEEMSAEKYCFKSISESHLARQKLAGILIPSDVVTLDNECIVIQMKPHRRELLQRYILTLFPSASVSFSSNEIRRDPCRLKIEKEKVIKNDDVSITKASESDAKSTEVYLVETLNNFTIFLDENEIKGSCRYITPSRYEIEIEVSKTQIDQKTVKLQTQLQIQKGDRIEIGQVIKELEEKNTEINLRPSLRVNAKNELQEERVFLGLQ
jgi:hypothetical protein